MLAFLLNGYELSSDRSLFGQLLNFSSPGNDCGINHDRANVRICAIKSFLVIILGII
ncbi:MAG: hypothetical protein H8D87_14900 [Deltaproteobacteria bacterium]|uniref:hypothetical protein n=1 Tax=Desulfobacula sp. TaxID=2593537 RepID=UPI0019986751|nr:hypothetical protein [Candidatus Desulfobacula maris]MBL6993297.1 hypothetical protein [Desulfobacula sp.]